MAGICTVEEHEATRSICPCVGFDGHCHSCPDPDLLPPCQQGLSASRGVRDDQQKRTPQLATRSGSAYHHREQFGGWEAEEWGGESGTPTEAHSVTRIGRFFVWLARKHPTAAIVLSGGMRDSGRSKVLAAVEYFHGRED